MTFQHTSLAFEVEFFVRLRRFLRHRLAIRHVLASICNNGRGGRGSRPAAGIPRRDAASTSTLTPKLAGPWRRPVRRRRRPPHRGRHRGGGPRAAVLFGIIGRIRSMWLLLQLIAQTKLNKTNLGTKPLAKRKSEERETLGIVRTPSVANDRATAALGTPALARGRARGGATAPGGGHALFRALFVAGFIFQGDSHYVGAGELVPSAEACAARAVAPIVAGENASFGTFLVATLSATIAFAFGFGVLLGHVVTRAAMSRRPRHTPATTDSVPPIVQGTRSVAIQSQTTYLWRHAQPRFQPLGERAQGAWIE